MVDATGGLKAQIEKDIKDNKAMIYSKSYCPHAKATKDLFAAQNLAAKIIELDNVGNGAEIQNTLKQMTNQGTVPNVFINGKHIGGNSDVQALHQQGKLVSTYNA